MKRFRSLLFALLLCVMMLLGVCADMGMPEYAPEQIVVSNPDGAKLYTNYIKLTDTGEVVPYGIILEADLGSNAYYYDEETGTGFHAVTYRGHERLIAVGDFVSIDAWDGPFPPKEDDYDPSAHDASHALVDAYESAGESVSASLSLPMILFIAFDAVLAAVIVVLIIISIKRSKRG